MCYVKVAVIESIKNKVKNQFYEAKIYFTGYRAPNTIQAYTSNNGSL